MSEGFNILEGYVERIAALLHEHMDLVDSIERYVSFMTSLDEVKETHINALRDQLENLSQLRSSIIESMGRAVEAARESRGAGEEALSDLYALISYYVEAGAVKEMSVLKKASLFLDMKSHIERSERAREEASRIVEELEGLSGEG